MLFEHSEHLEPRPVDLTADVTLACLIVCEQHIASGLPVCGGFAFMSSCVDRVLWTWNRWRNQYGGMNTNGAKQLKELQVENARLKKLLAEAELDKAMLKELAEGKW